jgi:predicted XRE-type DNA-binding protein
MRTLFGRQETYAHRIAWILHHGRRPRRGHHIALVCGLPACCNWMHLQERRPQATQAAYLRSARVAQRRRALKVTPALAERLRQAWHAQQPVTQRQFAAQWGLSQPTVSQILRAERHKPAPMGVL